MVFLTPFISIILSIFMELSHCPLQNLPINKDGSALNSFKLLKPQRINSFADHSYEFLNNYVLYIQDPKGSGSLFLVSKCTGKSLKDYVERYSMDMLFIDDLVLCIILVVLLLEPFSVMICIFPSLSVALSIIIMEKP